MDKSVQQEDMKEPAMQRRSKNIWEREERSKDFRKFGNHKSPAGLMSDEGVIAEGAPQLCQLVLSGKRMAFARQQT